MIEGLIEIGGEGVPSCPESHFRHLGDHVACKQKRETVL